MSRITLDNLSDNLKAYLESLGESGSPGLTIEQINTIILNAVGNPDNLNTTDKTNFVNAFNELKNDFSLLQLKYEELKRVVDSELEVIECESIQLNTDNLNFSELETSQELIATVLPSACNENIMWLSTDESVATVSNGVVTSKNDGECIITAICGDKNDMCNVTVSSIKEVVLLEKGVFNNDTMFGTSNFNTSTNMSYDTDIGCIKLSPASKRCVVFSFNNYIDPGIFTSNSKLKIKGYLAYNPSNNVYMNVALSLGHTSEALDDISTTVPSVLNTIEIDQGTQSYEYIVYLSAFKDYGGYLNLCFGQGLASMLITDIVCEI